MIKKTAILVVDEVPLNDHLVVIKNRLEDKLEFAVEILSETETRNRDIIEADLIVICSKNVPPYFRDLAVPIVICYPEVLYELGMTLATSGLDFGYSKETAQVEVKTQRSKVGGSLVVMQ